MPPSKNRTLADDPRSDLANGKDKPATVAGGATGSRGGRRNGPANVMNGSSLKEVVSTSDVTAMDGFGDPRMQNGGGSGMSWGNEDRSLLQEYRFAYRLDTPSAFKAPLSHIILSTGIGRHSPTMARRKTKRRVHKHQLALAIRKNFNALAVNESDVIVGLMYKARNHDKAFNAKFAPPRAR